MKTRTAFKLATILLASSFMAAPAAEAGGFKLFGSKIELAYAPQKTRLDNRFDQFESEEELHVLNDAWLGMPVRAKDGNIIGFVEDAYLSVDGDLTELLIGLSGKKYAVYLDGQYAELTDTAVNVTLNSATIAGLEREESVQFSSR